MGATDDLRAAVAEDDEAAVGREAIGGFVEAELMDLLGGGTGCFAAESAACGAGLVVGGLTEPDPNVPEFNT